jgi:hypothetical protein
MKYSFFRLKSPQLVLLLLLCIVLQSRAAEWTQFRGPNHDSATTEQIATVWPPEGPRRLWPAPMIGGFSSITVSGGKAFTLVQRNIEGAEREVCIALDTMTGKELWATPLAVAKYDKGGDNGTS